MNLENNPSNVTVQVTEARHKGAHISPHVVIIFHCWDKITGDQKTKQDKNPSQETKQQQQKLTKLGFLLVYGSKEEVHNGQTNMTLGTRCKMAGHVLSHRKLGRANYKLGEL